MKVRNLVMSLGAASALAAAPAFAQTAVVVEPLPPNTAVIITDQRSATVSRDLPVGTHLATDQYGRAIIVDNAYATPGSNTTVPPQRSGMFDSSVDPITGTVTSPGYMGPRDTTGQ